MHRRMTGGGGMVHGATLMLSLHSSLSTTISFSEQAASPMSHRKAGERAFSPKLVREMVRVAQLSPEVGYPSPLTMNVSGWLKSTASSKVGHDLMYAAHSCNGHSSATHTGGPST